jgi:hypothetical protein
LKTDSLRVPITIYLSFLPRYNKPEVGSIASTYLTHLKQSRLVVLPTAAPLQEEAYIGFWGFEAERFDGLDGLEGWLAK